MRAMTVKVLPGQKLIDLAMQELGSAEYVWELAVVNDMLPSDTPQTGAFLLLPDVVVNNPLVVRELRRRNPASSCGGADADSAQGIGHWAIGEDFIVGVDDVLGEQPQPEGIGFWAIEDSFIVSADPVNNEGVGFWSIEDDFIIS